MAREPREKKLKPKQEYLNLIQEYNKKAKYYDNVSRRLADTQKLIVNMQAKVEDYKNDIARLESSIIMYDEKIIKYTEKVKELDNDKNYQEYVSLRDYNNNLQNEINLLKKDKENAVKKEYYQEEYQRAYTSVELEYNMLFEEFMPKTVTKYRTDYRTKTREVPDEYERDKIQKEIDAKRKDIKEVPESEYEEVYNEDYPSKLSGAKRSKHEATGDIEIYKKKIVSTEESVEDLKKKEVDLTQEAEKADKDFKKIEKDREWIERNLAQGFGKKRLVAKNKDKFISPQVPLL